MPEPKHLIDKLAEDLWTKVDIEEERLVSNDELLADIERFNPQLEGQPDPKTGSSSSMKRKRECPAYCLAEEQRHQYIQGALENDLLSAMANALGLCAEWY